MRLSKLLIEQDILDIYITTDYYKEIFVEKGVTNLTKI